MSTDLRNAVAGHNVEGAADAAESYAIDHHVKTDAMVPAVLALAFNLERLADAVERIANTLAHAGSEQ